MRPSTRSSTPTFATDRSTIARSNSSARTSIAMSRRSTSERRPRAGMSKPAQQAFWLNAYNALVLRTVIDGYPISGKAPAYPSNSVRQIPGAFERLKHRVAGESLTLDEIETTKILPFGDARMLLALGRGAIGSHRLRSEAYPRRHARNAARRSRQRVRHARKCASGSTSWRGPSRCRRSSAGTPQRSRNTFPAKRPGRGRTAAPLERADRDDAGAASVCRRARLPPRQSLPAEVPRRSTGR